MKGWMKNGEKSMLNVWRKIMVEMDGNEEIEWVARVERFFRRGEYHDSK